MIYRVYDDKRHEVVADGDKASPEMYRLVEADAAGWIDWDGGECPLPDGARCDIKTEHEIEYDHDSGIYIWDHDFDNQGCCIIAYRPILDAKPSKPRCSDERPCIPCYTGKGPCEAPEWDGGLPPVGVECELLGTPTGSWSVGVIDYIDAKHCIWHWADGSGETMYNRVGNMKFRRQAGASPNEEKLDE